METYQDIWKKKRAAILSVIIGALALFWFVVRVIPKPTRAAYPCQRAAFPIASAFVIWVVGSGATLLTFSRSWVRAAVEKGNGAGFAAVLFGIASVSFSLQTCTDSGQTSTLALNNEDKDAYCEGDPNAPCGESTVAIVQAEKAALSLESADIQELVEDAVEQAGGLDFIEDGQTVVLKPNLVAQRTTGGMKLSMLANGVTTDWRIAYSVANLVRDKNPSGKIWIMEGAVHDTEDGFEQFGYTSNHFEDTVDGFIPLEGESCESPSTEHLIEVEAESGKRYFVDERFYHADVVVSLPVLKTHFNAGITGAIKNIGIGMTPVGKYQHSSADCTRSFEIINHDDPEVLSEWIRDVYSLNPAKFSVMDGLRGLANGPEPSWNGGNYKTDVKDMRLIIASKDAVALDTVSALLMGCEPSLVPVLSLSNESGLGNDDVDEIVTVGKSIEDVMQRLEGSFACPGA